MKMLYQPSVIVLLTGALPNADRFIPDRNYNLPTRRWLLGDFARWYAGVLGALKVFAWATNHDCDDKAQGFAWLAGVLHRRSRGKAEGLAVFEMFYKLDSGGGHAINVAITDDERVIFIEPQGPREIQLSRREKESCWFVR